MKLELDIINIKDVQFGEKTIVSNGTLYIKRDELRQLLLEDKRLKEIGIELAHPGEKCRILAISDVTEPRAKVDCDVNFPGAMGVQGIVGNGHTCVLRGTAVMTSDFTETGQMSREVYGEILDMSGPAAEASVYGKTLNVVIAPLPAEGVDLQDYRVALKAAGIKTAVYLGKAGIGLKPDEIEVYELPALMEISEDVRKLPRVAYIFQVLSAQFKVVPGEAVLFGNNIDRSVPTILHPNQVLDGALAAPYVTFGGDTYTIQNHPIVKEMYRRHGKELCFVGVILTVAHHNQPENERTAVMAANLAKFVVGADGVVLTKTGGGAPEIFTGLTVQRCEEVGIKTTIAILHMVADPKEASFSSTVAFNTPEADAMVSMGTPLAMLTLPPVDRVIGKLIEGASAPNISGELKRPLLWIKGAASQMGVSKLKLVPS